MQLKEIVKNYRMEKGISQREFARLIGCSDYPIRNLEKTGICSMTTKNKIIRFLNLKNVEEDEYSDEKILGIYIRSTRECLKFRQRDIAQMVDSSIKIVNMIENGAFYGDYSKDVFKNLRLILDLFKKDFLYTDEFKQALLNLKLRIGEDNSIYSYPKFINNMSVSEIDFNKWLYLSRVKSTNKDQNMVIGGMLFTNNNCIYSEDSLKVAYQTNFRGLKDKFDNFEELRQFVLDNFNKILNILSIYTKGIKLNMLAKEFKVSAATIHALYSRKIFKISSASIYTICKSIEKYGDIIEDDNIIKLIKELNFIICDYIDTTKYINENIEPKSIEIETEEDKECTVENIINEVSEIGDRAIKEIDEYIDNFNKQEEISLTKEGSIHNDNHINPFDGLSESFVNVFKSDMIDKIFKLIENNNIDLAESYIELSENMSLFNTEIFRIKLNNSKVHK